MRAHRPAGQDHHQVGRWRRTGSGWRWSPTCGRGRVVNPDGSTALQLDWEPNLLLDEGEANLLNEWLLEQAALTRYLCLMISTAPAETDTMAVLATKELFAPPLNGYARQQVIAADWGAPTLNAGDMQTTAAEKTFGAATAAWNSITGVGIVTASTGQLAGSGKFLIHTPTSATTNVAIGQSFKWTQTTKGQ